MVGNRTGNPGHVVRHGGSIPLSSAKFAPVAKSGKAADCKSVHRGFKSLSVLQITRDCIVG